MNRNIHIQEELLECSKLVAEIPFVNPYTVDKQYFANLSAAILLKINKENIYQVPNGYFENLSGTILNKIKVEENENELEEIAPTLASLKKVNVYTTPADYFDQLAIPTQVTADAKVVSFTSKKKTSWMKYAAAACVVGIISISAFMFFNKKNTVLPQNTIANTGKTLEQIKAMDVDAELAKISDAEMDKYVCESGLIACNDNSTEELQKELNNLELTDEDLNALLNETTNN
jgi:hypothetical protein